MKKCFQKKRIAYLVFCMLVATLCHAQPGDKHKNLTDFDFPSSIDRTLPFIQQYTNINHATAVKYQNIKRGLFWITKRIGSKKGEQVACFLLNTASQNKKPYMISPASLFDTNAIVNSTEEVTIMPNYEIPNNTDGSPSRRLQGNWRTMIKLLVLDRKADIALFEVLDPDRTFGNKAKYKGLYNAYALGWNISPPLEDDQNPNVLKNYVKAAISFPYNTHKRILLNPRSVSYNYHSKLSTPINFKEGYAFTINWDISPVPKEGSYGSPLFNDESQVIGLHTGPGLNWNKNPPKKLTNRFLYTDLRNSWQYQKRITDDQGEITQPAGLIDYLDPHGTHVTSVPGGYWADLTSFPDPVAPKTAPDAFSFNMKSGKTQVLLAQDFYLNWFDFQQNPLRILQNSNNNDDEDEFQFPIGPFGIKVNGALSNSQRLLLYITTMIGQEEHLLWAVQARARETDDTDATYDPFNLNGTNFLASEIEIPDALSIDTKFAQLVMPHERPANLPLQSHTIKTNFVQLGVKYHRLANSGVAHLSHRNFYPPVKIYLSRLDLDPNPIFVTAWGIPGKLAENVKQNQNAPAVKNAFESKKYKRLQVMPNTTGLYLDYLNVLQKSKNDKFVSNLSIIGRYIFNYPSSDNGGYLNMVNPLTYIKNVVCTYTYQDENRNLVDEPKRMRLTFKVPSICSNGACKYKVWIDYNKDHRFSGNYNNNPNITEIIKQGNLTVRENRHESNIYIVDYTLPNNQDLDIGYGEKKAYRLRVAVSTGTIPEQPTNDDEAWAMPNGEVEDYLIVLKGLSTEEIEAEQQAKDKDIANQRQGRRGQKRNHPDENPNDTADDQRNEDIQDQVYNRPPDPPGARLANSRVPIMAIVDNGKLPQVLSPLLVRTEAILTLAYEQVVKLSGSGPNDPPIGDESCSGSPLPDDQFPGYDPNDAASWQHWEKFNSLYNNIARIIRFWDNLHLDFGGTPIPFIENDAKSYALWNALVQAYNLGRFLKNGNINLEAFQDEHGVFSFTKWQDAVNAYFAEGGPLANVETIYDLLYLVYSNDALMNGVFEEEEAGIYRQLFQYILKFQCFKEQVIEASNTLNVIYDLTKSNTHIAVDYLGQVLDQISKFRELTHEFVLKDLPDAVNQMAVVWQAKGKSNSTFLGIDHQGFIVYEVKNDNEVKTITASMKLSEDEDVALDARFIEGKMELDINGNLKESTESFKATTHGFHDFLAVGNGASFGAPLSNTTDPIFKTINGVTYKLVPLDAHWKNTFFTGNNTGLQQRSSSTTTKGIKTINLSEDALQTLTNANGFQIFPNPTDGELNILVEVQEAGPLQINIFDLTGRLVYEKEEAQISEGLQRITLKDIKLVAGQYIVKVTASNVIQSEIVTFE